MIFFSQIVTVVVPSNNSHPKVILDMTEEVKSLTRNLSFAAAVLILLGSLTGIYVSAAMTNKLDVDAHAALASHLNAYLGAFWMIGVAWTFQFSSLSVKSMRILAVLVSLANYSNWLITAIKAALKENGLDFVGSAANKGIHGGLVLFVVLPTLIASVMWAWGLRPGSKASADA